MMMMVMMIMMMIIMAMTMGSPALIFHHAFLVYPLYDFAVFGWTSIRDTMEVGGEDDLALITNHYDHNDDGHGYDDGDGGGGADDDDHDHAFFICS